jgi:hypothetical protein
VDAVCGVGPGLPACTGPAPGGVTGATGWVKVATSTATPGGGHQVRFVLGPIISSLTGSTVRATSVAAWGPMGQASAVPIIFSECEFQFLGGNVGTGTFPSGNAYIYLHGVGGTNETGVSHCTASTSGQDLPGGFGYLANTNCVATVTAGGMVGVEPGNSFPVGCDAASWLNKEILMMIFDSETGSGNTGQYHVAGFVGFTLLGYKFQGNNKAPSSFKCPLGNGNNVVCLYGSFTRVVAGSGGFGGYDFGARVIKMVG